MYPEGGRQGREGEKKAEAMPEDIESEGRFRSGYFQLDPDFPLFVQGSWAELGGPHISRAVKEVPDCYGLRPFPG